jgi:hypothetical protein
MELKQEVRKFNQRDVGEIQLNKGRMKSQFDLIKLIEIKLINDIYKNRDLIKSIWAKSSQE